MVVAKAQNLNLYSLHSNKSIEKIIISSEDVLYVFIYVMFLEKKDERMKLTNLTIVLYFSVFLSISLLPRLLTSLLRAFRLASLCMDTLEFTALDET